MGEMAVEQTLAERLSEGCVCHARRWSGDTHDDLGGTVNEAATDALMQEAAGTIATLAAQVEALQSSLGQLYGAKFSDRCYSALKSRAEAAEVRAEALADALREVREPLEWAMQTAYGEFSDYSRADKYEAIGKRLDAHLANGATP